MATVKLTELLETDPSENVTQLFYKTNLDQILCLHRMTHSLSLTCSLYELLIFIYLFKCDTFFSHSDNSFERKLKMDVAGNRPARETSLPALPLRKTSSPDLPPLNWRKFDLRAHLAELWRKRRAKLSSWL